MNYSGFKAKKQNKFIMLCAFAVAVLVIGVAVSLVSKAVEDHKGYRTIGVVETKGNVTVVKDGIDYKAYPGMHLQEGQVLVTAGESSVRLVLDGDKYIKVESGSRVVFETLGLLGSGKTKLILERGSMTGELVNPLESGQEFVVNTPNAVLAVRGTFFRVSLETYGKEEVRTNVLTYGGAVASKRIFPSGEIEEEEVLVESGYKTAIHMDTEDTFYVLEKEDGAKDTTGDSNNDIEPIYREDIADDDWVDIYYAAENGHELFVTTKEAQKEIETRNISLENTAPVYEKAAEMFREKEANPVKKKESTQVFSNIFADDSKSLAMMEESEDTDEKDRTEGATLVTGEELQSGLLTDGNGGETIPEETTDEASTEELKEEAVEEESLEESVEEEITAEVAGSEEVTGEESDEEEALGNEDAAETESVESTEDLGNSGTSGGNSGTSGSSDGSDDGGNAGDSDETEDDAHTHTEVYVGDKTTHSKCEDCGEILSTTHEYAEEVTKAATCTAEGIRLYRCACGYSYEESIDALGHTAVNGGLAGVHSKCEDCGEILSTVHEYTERVTKAATCTAEGTRLYSCTCGHSYEESIDALGHTSVNGGQADVHSKCDTCGETLSTSHEYTDRVTKEATCTEEGILQYSCTCGYYYEEPIDATGHTPVYGGEEDVHQKCDICGEVLADGSAHVLTELNRTEPTCTAKGVSNMECVCGYEEQEIYEPLFHQYEESTNTCSTCGLPMVAIDSVNFPDTMFRSYVESFDTNIDGYLYSTELVKVTSIDISGTEWSGGGYTSLQGISYFTQLKSLNCSYNESLDALDLRLNTNLQTLNVTGCTWLASLHVSNTKLVELDVSDLENLVYIEAKNCPELYLVAGDSCAALTEIDASNCPKLYSASFTDAASLRTVNMSGNADMYMLVLNNCTSLESVDVTSCGSSAGNFFIMANGTNKTTSILTGFDSNMTFQSD